MLIVGSSSLTHNLAELRSGPGDHPAYAAELAAWVRDAVVHGDSAQRRQTLALADADIAMAAGLEAGQVRTQRAFCLLKFGPRAPK